MGVVATRSLGYLSVDDVQVEDEDAMDEEIDTLKFRLVLRPETEENNNVSGSQPSSAESAAPLESKNGPGEDVGSTSALPLHRLMIQTVGGRSCSQVRSAEKCSASWSWSRHERVMIREALDATLAVRRLPGLVDFCTLNRAWLSPGSCLSASLESFARFIHPTCRNREWLPSFNVAVFA